MIKSGSVLAMGVAFVLAVSASAFAQGGGAGGGGAGGAGGAGSWLAIRRRHKRCRRGPDEPR
jgi:hypothetical protein